MKATIVPAQITTVEDKIAGNLSLNQLVLLVASVFIGSAIFIVLPPSLEFMVYKAVIIGIVAVICCALAIRIKGRILLLWLTIILKYRMRPRYYIFNKNSLYLREPQNKAQQREIVEAQEDEIPEEIIATSISLADAVRLKDIIADPRANLHFKRDRKGALRVYITEVKQ